MSREKSPHSIVIIGPHSDENLVADIAKALANPPGSAIILGDGKRDISLEEIQQALTESGEHTHIHLFMHGHTENGVHFVQNTNQGTIPTASLLAHIKEAKGTVHLWSCHGGAASENVTQLGEGATLICHSSQKFFTLSRMNADSIIRHHQFYQQTADTHKRPPNAYDAFEFSFLTSAETVVFSQAVATPVKQAEAAATQQPAIQATKPFKVCAPKQAVSEKELDRYLRNKRDEFQQFRVGTLGHSRETFLEVDKEDIQQASSIRTVMTQENREHYLEQAFTIAIDRGREKYVEQSINLGIPPDAQLIIGDYPLHLACNRGYAPVIKTLLDKGADITKPDFKGSTPLMIAAYHGKVEAVETLLSHSTTLEGLLAQRPHDALRKALNIAPTNAAQQTIAQKIEEKTKELLLQEPDPNKVLSNGQTPFIFACAKGYIDVANTLLEKGADVERQSRGNKPLYLALLQEPDPNRIVNNNGQTPFMIACETGYADAVSLLLDKGANINQADSAGFSPLFLAYRAGHMNIVATLLEKGADTEMRPKGSTLLHMACIFGQMDVIDALLSAGANPLTPDATGFTPLMIAATNGREEVVDRLLGNPLMTLAHLEAENQEGENAISCAQGNPDILKKINGKRLELLMEEETRLTYQEVITRFGWGDAVETFLDQGADINKPDSDNMTLLFLACRDGETEIIRKLLSHGADPNLPSCNGETPLSSASKNGHAEIVQELLNAGANPLENAHDAPPFKEKPKTFVERVNAPSSGQGIGM